MDKINKFISNDSFDETIKVDLQSIIDFYNKNGYTNYRDTLYLIVKLCKNANVTEEISLLARAYFWLGAKYRNEAIKCYEIYFKKIDLDSYNKQYPLFLEGEERIIYDKFHHDLFSDLLQYSESLEKNYAFEKAFAVLNKADELFPFDYTIHRKQFGILKKMNKLDEAIELIQKCLTSEWAQPYKKYDEIRKKEYIIDNNKRALEEDLKTFIELKNKGYIYKSRKRNK